MKCQRVGRKAILAVAVSPDGKTLVAAGEEGTTGIFDVATGTCRKKLRFAEFPWGAAALALAITPDGSRLVSGHRDNVVRVHGLPGGGLVHEWHGHQGRTSISPLDGEESFDAGSVWCVAVSPDGRLVVSGSSDETFRLWNQADGKCAQVITGSLDMRAAAFLPDGKSLLTGGFDRALRRIPQGTVIRKYGVRRNLSAVTAIRVDPRGAWAVTAHPKSFNYDNHRPGDENVLLVWDLATGTQMGTCPFPLTYNLCMDLSPDGRFLVSNHVGPGLVLWEMPSGGRLGEFGQEAGKVTALAWSGDRIFAGDEQGNLRSVQLPSRVTE